MNRRWISVSDVAEYLSIHEVTCRRLIDRGKIPAVKIGGSVRVDLRALDEWLERNTVHPTFLWVTG